MTRRDAQRWQHRLARKIEEDNLKIEETEACLNAES
jgi:hypothetical protein